MKAPLSSSSSVLLILLVEASTSGDVDGIVPSVLVSSSPLLSPTLWLHLDDVVVIPGLRGMSLGHVIGSVVRDDRLLSSDPQTTVDCFQKTTDGVAMCGDLDVHPLIVALSVNHRKGFSPFRVDVLCYISSVGVAAITERFTREVDAVWVAALLAAAGVRGELFHDEDLVVAGLAAVGGQRGKVHLAVDHAGHVGSWRSTVWFKGLVSWAGGGRRGYRRPRIVVVDGGMDGRQLER